MNKNEVLEILVDGEYSSYLDLLNESKTNDEIDKILKEFYRFYKNTFSSTAEYVGDPENMSEIMRLFGDSISVLGGDETNLDNIGVCINMKHLTISHTNIKEIPESIKKLKNLESVRITWNKSFEMNEKNTNDIISMNPKCIFINGNAQGLIPSNIGWHILNNGYSESPHLSDIGSVAYEKAS